MNNLKTTKHNERLDSIQPIGEFNTKLDENEIGLDKIVMPLIHGQPATTTISEANLFEKVASEYPLTGAMDENGNVNASEMNPTAIETIEHLKGKANILGERLFAADNQDSDPTTDNTLRVLNGTMDILHSADNSDMDTFTNNTTHSMEELVSVVRENNTNANDLNENAVLYGQSAEPSPIDSVEQKNIINPESLYAQVGLVNGLTDNLDYVPTEATKDETQHPTTGVVEFWESLFKDFDNVPFPLISDRREMQSSHEEIGTFEVNLTKFDHIKEIFDVSQYAIMQTIWTLVVYYFQRSDHIAFGSATNNIGTELTHYQNRIGMKINTSPVPVPLTPSTKISDIMKYLHDFHYQTIPYLKPNFSILRKWIHHQSNEIFFDTAFNYIRQGSEIESLPIQTTLSKTMSDVQFPLSMSIIESPDSLTWRASYNPKAITLDTIKKISNTFHNIMDMILSGENHTVVDMCALPREEFSILERFGTGLRVDIQYDCAHHPFEEIARNEPDLIAVEHEDRFITYGELNERAEEIACLLMDRGVRVGDYVGLVTTRSIEMVCGIFGILKAGGAYIPIDHELPLERIQYMLE
ncbi:hypothetical protein BC833DRAFT_546082, partial [Globomyces pollinis-pini]